MAESTHLQKRRSSIPLCGNVYQEEVQSFISNIVELQSKTAVKVFMLYNIPVIRKSPRKSKLPEGFYGVLTEFLLSISYEIPVESLKNISLKFLASNDFQKWLNEVQCENYPGLFNEEMITRSPNRNIAIDLNDTFLEEEQTNHLRSDEMQLFDGFKLFPLDQCAETGQCNYLALQLQTQHLNSITAALDFKSDSKREKVFMERYNDRTKKREDSLKRLRYNLKSRKCKGPELMEMLQRNVENIMKVTDEEFNEIERVLRDHNMKMLVESGHLNVSAYYHDFKKRIEDHQRNPGSTPSEDWSRRRRLEKPQIVDGEGILIHEDESRPNSSIEDHLKASKNIFPFDSDDEDSFHPKINEF